MAGPRQVSAPHSGIWRIGRGANPLAPPVRHGVLTATTSGNRFDSETSSFAVLYFATELEGCFGETLARFRPSLDVCAEIADEWRALGFMEVGSVPAEWRQRRSAVNVRLPDDALFLDVEALSTHSFFRRELAVGISALGYDDIDVAVVRGRDRRVTRLIAEWAYRQVNELDEVVYAGIRYLSRIDSRWECWAVFDDIELEVIETRPITLSSEALQRVASEFSLTVH